MPRFLPQRSALTRMVAVLLFCAVLPAIVLAAYGVKGLLEADTVYESGIREQREQSAARLRATMMRNGEEVLRSLDTAATTVCNEQQWLLSSDSCARGLLAHSQRVREVLLLDRKGGLIFPVPNKDGTQSTALHGLKLLAKTAEPKGSNFALRGLNSEEASLVAADAMRGAVRVLVSIDQDLLLGEWRPMVTAFNRTNPGLTAQILPQGGLADQEQSTGQWLAALEPWLPRQLLSVSSVAFATENPAGGYRMGLQISLLLALVLIVVAAVWVSADTLSREVGLARMKSDFVSTVSHELRTPLTTIRIMAEMLALGAVPNGEKQAEYHRNIVSEAERLTRLINNVLDFARIEEGRKKFVFGMGDIGDVVFEVVRIIGDYASKEGFEITTTVQEGLPATCFDRDAIIQALINLTANAVKYSEEDKRIEVGARCERDTIVVWVADHGPGIDPEELPHLFEKFFRAGEHLTREIGGTGLGLAIVQHIVHAHGGEVSARSTVGEGSTFEIHLPVRQQEQQMSAERQR